MSPTSSRGRSFGETGRLPRSAAKKSPPASPPASPAPIFLGLALHRRRFRVLELEPVLRPAGAIARPEPLRHDALEPELAGVLKYALAIVGEARSGAAPEGSRAAGSRASPCASPAARAAGLGHPAQGGRKRRGRHACRLAPQLLEHREPVLIAGDRLATDQAGAATQLLPQPQLPFQPSSRVATGKSSELRPVSQYTASPTHSCTAVSVRRNPSLTLAKGCSASSTPRVRQSTG
jgi:hypothetical protein